MFVAILSKHLDALLPSCNISTTVHIFHLRWRLIYLLLHLLKMSLLNSCMPWCRDVVPPGESHGKSPSWAWYLFTSDRTRSYSLSWAQTSNHQHFPALPWHVFQNFQCSLSWTSWEKKNENHEVRLEGLKFNHFTRGFFRKSWMHQLQRDAGLFAPQNAPSHTFTILSRLDITNNLPNLTHLTIYIYIRICKFNKLIQLQYHLSHQAKSLPMSSKQSSRLVTRRSMAVKATSHPLRPSKTVKEAAFSGSSACAKDNRGAPLVSRHCSWIFFGTTEVEGCEIQKKTS